MVWHCLQSWDLQLWQGSQTWPNLIWSQFRRSWVVLRMTNLLHHLRHDPTLTDATCWTNRRRRRLSRRSQFEFKNQPACSRPLFHSPSSCWCIRWVRFVTHQIVIPAVVVVVVKSRDFRDMQKDPLRFALFVRYDGGWRRSGWKLKAPEVGPPIDSVPFCARSDIFQNCIVLLSVWVK